MPTFREDIKLGTKVPMMKTDDLNDQSVSEAKLRDGSVTTKKVADDAITTAKIKDGNVTTEKIADAAVTTEKIADGNITTDKLANSSVTTAKIEDNAVTTSKIKDGDVTTSKIAEGNVTTSKIADSNVTSSKIADGNVTTSKIADNAVTLGKLDPSIRAEITTSTSAAIEATQQAKEATAKADEATTAANTATLAATEAKQAADAATEQAKEATAKADQATELANAATEQANTAAATANEAATKADTSREQTEQTLVDMQEVIDKAAVRDDEGNLVDNPFHYIQSEQYIFAQVDANNNFLFGITWNGTPVFAKTSSIEDNLQKQVDELAMRVADIMGDDDTTSIIDTMNELRSFFANIENTQTLTNILANLNTLDAKFGEDIASLKSTKVDKEEGKGLIETAVSSKLSIVDLDGYLFALNDANGNFLGGIRDSGTWYIPAGIPDDSRKLLDSVQKQIDDIVYLRDSVYNITEQEGYLLAFKDNKGNFLGGIRKSGQWDIPSGIPADTEIRLKAFEAKLDNAIAALQKSLIGTVRAEAFSEHEYADFFRK